MTTTPEQDTITVRVGVSSKLPTSQVAEFLQKRDKAVYVIVNRYTLDEIRELTKYGIDPSEVLGVLTDFHVDADRFLTATFKAMVQYRWLYEIPDLRFEASCVVRVTETPDNAVVIGLPFVAVGTPGIKTTLTPTPTMLEGYGMTADQVKAHTAHLVAKHKPLTMTGKDWFKLRTVNHSDFRLLAVYSANRGLLNKDFPYWRERSLNAKTAMPGFTYAGIAASAGKLPSGFTEWSTPMNGNHGGVSVGHYLAKRGLLPDDFDRWGEGADQNDDQNTYAHTCAIWVGQTKRKLPASLPESVWRLKNRYNEEVIDMAVHHGTLNPQFNNWSMTMPSGVSVGETYITRGHMLPSGFTDWGHKTNSGETLAEAHFRKFLSMPLGFDSWDMVTSTGEKLMFTPMAVGRMAHTAISKYWGMRDLKGNALAHYVAYCRAPAAAVVMGTGVDCKITDSNGWTPLQIAQCDEASFKRLRRLSKVVHCSMVTQETIDKISEYYEPICGKERRLQWLSTP